MSPHLIAFSLCFVFSWLVVGSFSVPSLLMCLASFGRYARTTLSLHFRPFTPRLLTILTPIPAFPSYTSSPTLNSPFSSIYLLPNSCLHLVLCTRVDGFSLYEFTHACCLCMVILDVSYVCISNTDLLLLFRHSNLPWMTLLNCPFCSLHCAWSIRVGI